MSNDYSNSAGLMWPASFHGSEKIDDPHCTIVFLGEADKLRVGPQYILTELRDYLDPPANISVTGTEIFGQDEKVWVALLDTEVLKPLQAEILSIIETKLGLENASDFKDFKPHVTLGPVVEGEETPEAPESVDLLSLQVWLGKERYIGVL